MKKYTRILISDQERLALELLIGYTKFLEGLAGSITNHNYDDTKSIPVIKNLLERSKHKEK